jgi:hypothetical protein
MNKHDLIVCGLHDHQRTVVVKQIISTLTMYRDTECPRNSNRVLRITYVFDSKRDFSVHTGNGGRAHEILVYSSPSR